MKGNHEKLEISPNILAIISVAVTVLILILIFKFKGGILGIILGALAVAALIYWLREIKKLFKEVSLSSKNEEEWFYDIIDNGEDMTLIARVPGQTRDVKVKLLRGFLEIKGDGNFTRRVRLLSKVELKDKSYINGVLYVRLQKQKEA